MKNIVVLHDNLFGDAIGSTEKLLLDMISMLADSGDFIVHGVYNQQNGEIGLDRLGTRPRISLRSFASFGPPPPVTQPPVNAYLTLNVPLDRVLEECRPDAMLLVIGQPFNPYVLQLPPSVPLFIVSPFGAYASNGNVRKLYVSGHRNTLQLRNAGYAFAEQFLNPLHIPPFNAAKAAGRERHGPLIFGRTGRNDEAIFDPISIDAFARLERVYGDRVRYVYVNPSQRAETYARTAGVQRIEFRHWLSEEELRQFYRDIDVFAHARSDGETLGVSIVEALLAQNPVISHVSAFANEHHAFLHEPFGKIAPFRSVDAYYEAMAFFVENQALLGEIGTRGRDYVLPLFDADAITAKFLADMRDVCSYSGRPRDPLDIF